MAEIEPWHERWSFVLGLWLAAVVSVAVGIAVWLVSARAGGAIVVVTRKG